MTRNPRWTRDELILALDLYFRVSVAHTSASDPEVVKLSELLNSLDIHTEVPTNSDFRNANGVYMKLCNYLRFDPEYPGVGLDRGSKLDQEVWNEFVHDRERLAAIAQSIRENAKLLKEGNSLGYVTNGIEDEDFAEGRLLERLHKSVERNASLVKRKKSQVVKKHGQLACEVCGFDFEEVYGELGKDFAECHHLVPLSELRFETRTRLSDLAIVCANCHRMIHRAQPMPSIDDLKRLIVERSSH